MDDDQEAPPAPEWAGAFDEDGLPHGKGQMTYPPPPQGEEDEEELPGDVYKGDMVHGKRDGVGTYIHGGKLVGAIYTGEYKDNMRHGEGKLVFPDKSQYTGTFVENSIEGTGVFVYANGDMYQGGFQAGKRSGTGHYHYKEAGCQMLGLWQEGGFVHGRWIFKDGSQFYGSFDKLQPHEGAYYFTRSQWVQGGSYHSGTWAGSTPFVGGPAALDQLAPSAPRVSEPVKPEGSAAERALSRPGSFNSRQLAQSRMGMVRELFKKLDLNGNGVLETKELTEAFTRAAAADGKGPNHPSIRQKLSLMNMANVDGSDGLSLDEFAEHMKGLSHLYGSDARFGDFIADFFAVEVTVPGSSRTPSRAAASRPSTTTGQAKGPKAVRGLSKQRVALIQNCFKKLDTSGDGTVSKSELMEAFARSARAMGLSTESQSVRMKMASMHMTDMDGSGAIALEEFTAVLAVLSSMHEEDSHFEAFVEAFFAV